MTVRRTCLTTLVAALLVGVVIAALTGQLPSLLRPLRSLLTGDFAETEGVTRKVGEWDVTPLGNLHYRHHFPEQNRLLVGMAKKHAELWDTALGQRLAVLRECDKGLGTSALSPDGSQFVTGDPMREYRAVEDKQGARFLRIWETATGKLVKKIRVDLSGEGVGDSTDWQVSWPAPQTLLLELHSRWNPARASTGTAFGVVDIAQGRVVKVSQRLPIGERLTYSPDRKRAAASLEYNVWRDGSGGISRGGRGTTYDVQLVDMNAFRIIAQLDGGRAQNDGTPNSISTVAWSPDGRWLATVASNHTVWIWNGKDGQLVSTLVGHTDWVLSVCFAPDCETILTASEDDTACLWQVATGKLVHTLAGHTAGLTHAVFNADGTLVLTGGEDQTARLWEAKTGKQVRHWSKHESGVRSVAFAVDGESIRTRTAQGIERSWSLADGKLLAEQKPPTRTAHERYGVCFLREEGENTEIWGSSD